MYMTMLPTGIEQLTGAMPVGMIRSYQEARNDREDDPQLY